MILESLKNSKFSKNVLSKEALLMIDGGKTFNTEAHKGDTVTYSRCQFQNSSLYDKVIKGTDGFFEDSVANGVHDGAKAEWYLD